MSSDGDSVRFAHARSGGYSAPPTAQQTNGPAPRSFAIQQERLEEAMKGIIVYFGLPLLVTILFMFALRPVARGIGLVDRPGGRKMHVGEIPVIGGLAMAGGLAIGSLYSQGTIQGFPFFLAATALLVLVGALDDRYDLPPSVRFLAQI